MLNDNELNLNEDKEKELRNNYTINYMNIHHYDKDDVVKLKDNGIKIISTINEPLDNNNSIFKFNSDSDDNENDDNNINENTNDNILIEDINVTSCNKLEINKEPQEVNFNTIEETNFNREKNNNHNILNSNICNNENKSEDKNKLNNNNEKNNIAISVYNYDVEAININQVNENDIQENTINLNEKNINKDSEEDLKEKDTHNLVENFDKISETKESHNEINNILEIEGVVNSNINQQISENNITNADTPVKKPIINASNSKVVFSTNKSNKSNKSIHNSNLTNQVINTEVKKLIVTRIFKSIYNSKNNIYNNNEYNEFINFSESLYLFWVSHLIFKIIYVYRQKNQMKYTQYHTLLKTHYQKK